MQQSVLASDFLNLFNVRIFNIHANIWAAEDFDCYIWLFNKRTKDLRFTKIKHRQDSFNYNSFNFIYWRHLFQFELFQFELLLLHYSADVQ